MLMHDPSTWAMTARGWEIALREIGIIRDICAARNIRLAVCFMPSKPHVCIEHVIASWGPDCLARYLAGLFGDTEPDLQGLADNMDAQRNLLGAFCAERGIPFIDLYPVLREESFAPPLLYFCNDTHLSARGHEVVGTALYQWMVDATGKHGGDGREGDDATRQTGR
ncbi:MAG: hypothetical protein PHN82_03990 [bacterium]|nr:hypothetical protein [bacterium]